jgi:hypothetical protein
MNMILLFGYLIGLIPAALIGLTVYTLVYARTWFKHGKPYNANEVESNITAAIVLWPIIVMVLPFVAIFTTVAVLGRILFGGFFNIGHKIAKNMEEREKNMRQALALKEATERAKKVKAAEAGSYRKHLDLDHDDEEVPEPDWND